MTLRRFGISACTAIPEDLPPSLAQHGSCCRSSTSSSLSFQDTHRTRLVPLHESTTAALSVYAATRDRLCPRPRVDVFFCSSVGTALGRSGVDKTFRQITTALGLRTATTRPRVHDLRHGFAVRTLVNWQRQGVSIDRHLATLSGYLGHVAPSDTYWYLSAVPELMGLAANRLEVRFGSPR